MHDLTKNGKISLKMVQQMDLNAWAIRMTTESFCKAPLKTRLRGFIIAVNDIELTILPDPHPNPTETVDYRHMGNLVLDQIEVLEVNPISLVMMVKSFIKASPMVKQGVKFLSGDCLIIMRPFVDRELEKFSKVHPS